MPPTGSESPALYAVGMAPGQTEDDFDRQFIGKSGQLLRRTLSNAGMPGKTVRMKLSNGLLSYTDFDDVRFYNVVNCKPPSNDPTYSEKAFCSQRVREDIKKTKPTVLLILGADALSGIFPELSNVGVSITSMRGIQVPWRLPDGAPLIVIITYHPSYILRGVSDEDHSAWSGDINLACQLALSL